MIPTSDSGLTADPRLSSPTAARLFRQATVDFNQHRFAAAAHALTSVLALAPDNPTALKMMAVASQRLGNHASAIECFHKTNRIWPEDAMLRIGLGVSLAELDRVDEAIEQFRVACKLVPSFTDAWYDLGEALARQSYTQEAATALQKALALNPDHLLARLSLARVWTNFGQVDDAVREFREILHRDPGNAEGWFGLSYLNTDCFEPGDSELLERALARPGRPADEQERLRFAQAKLLEMRGDYPRAFDAFRAANELGQKRVRWNAAAAHQRVEAVLRAFQDTIPSPPDTEFGREAILVVSMPRSGSTLVEQILASHPEVEGASEIKSMAQVLEAETRRRRSLFPSWIPDATAQDWRRLGDEYLALTSRWRETKPRFTDKSLANWMLAGAALSMLPATRIIVVRRDPVETCLACYRQCLGSMYGFACDLADTADYYIDFLRLTRFWIQKYPDRVMDLEYERLVAEPDATTRQLLDFCGLPFDPACLAFHKTRRAVQSLPSAVQIRQGMRHDTARTARYGNQLDALRERLQSGGVQLADCP
jgi:Tfp pilus assembly protein PilF